MGREGPFRQPTVTDVMRREGVVETELLDAHSPLYCAAGLPAAPAAA